MITISHPSNPINPPRRRKTRKTYHITPQPGTRHRGEVRRASIVLTPPNDTHASQLSCSLVSHHSQGQVISKPPNRTFMKPLQHGRNQLPHAGKHLLGSGRHVGLRDRCG
jgi:hypothetical protein